MWGKTEFEDKDYYNSVKISETYREELIRAITFPDAYVTEYREKIDPHTGHGYFMLTVKQKMDKRTDIVIDPFNEVIPKFSEGVELGDMAAPTTNYPHENEESTGLSEILERGHLVASLEYVGAAGVAFANPSKAKPKCLVEWLDYRTGQDNRIPTTVGGIMYKLVWDAESSTAVVVMSNADINIYASFTKGENGCFIDPSDGRLYVDESILWEKFYHILDPPIEYSFAKEVVKTTILLVGIGKGVPLVVKGAERLFATAIAATKNLFGGNAKLADELTDLYRAVGPDEFYELMKTGKFDISPSTGGLYVKQFGLSYEETLAFANRFKDVGAIIEVKVPTNMLYKIAEGV